MNQEMEFKNIVAQYSKVVPEEMNNEMRFREDLGFSSLDFMSFLGELYCTGCRKPPSPLSPFRTIHVLFRDLSDNKPSVPL